MDKDDKGRINILGHRHTHTIETIAWSPDAK